MKEDNSECLSFRQLATSTQDREKALLEVLRRGLDISGKHKTRTMLGDRSTYVGLSDIGRYVECPRAALAARIRPELPTLERLLPLHRGHWFEEGIGNSLAAMGLHAMPQLEIRHIWQNTPIRAHLDVTLVWDTPIPAVRILEIKSMGGIPDTPYNAHEAQMQGQVGLLHALWNTPVFTLRDTNGSPLHENVTFPQLCRTRFGVVLPSTPKGVSLEGWLLCLSMKDARAFGPYAYDAESLRETLGCACDFWASLVSLHDGSLTLDAVPYAQGFYPLCGYCESNADCPKFQQGDDQPQWDNALGKLETLKRNRSALDVEIREIEMALRQAHQLSGTKNWISTGHYRFRTTTVAGRRTLDKIALQAELDEICALEKIERIDVDALLRRNEREGAPSVRLSVTPVN